MSIYHPHPSHAKRRPGLTLAELLIASAVMGIVAASLATLTSTVLMTNDYAQNLGGTAQYARVALQRIERACNEATTTADYPGFWTATTTVSSYSFPDALIVWSPTGSPANPDGPPLASELVCFTYDPNSPNQLLELRDASDSRSAPAITATSAWLSWVAALTQKSDISRVVLARSLRLAKVNSGDPKARACIRFETRYAPTTNEWANYQSGSLAWNEMTWPLNLYGAESGVRQSSCRIELQMMPLDVGNQVSTSEEVTPYFGSAVLNSELVK